MKMNCQLPHYEKIDEMKVNNNVVRVFKKIYNEYISMRYIVVNKKIEHRFIVIEENSKFIMQEQIDEMQLAINKLEREIKQWKQEHKIYTI